MQSRRPRPALGVVGVDQKRRVLGARAGESQERQGFVVVRLDERVGHGAVDRHPESRLRERGRRAGEAGEIAGPRREQAGLGAVRPTQTEVDERLAGGRQDHARRLGGDQGLEVQDVDQPALDQLRHRQGRGDPQDGAVIDPGMPGAQAPVLAGQEMERGVTHGSRELC